MFMKVATDIAVKLGTLIDSQRRIMWLSVIAKKANLEEH